MVFTVLLQDKFVVFNNNSNYGDWILFELNTLIVLDS